ncbi:hypothetical protein [uncultured Nitratireductor sp.]|uniref:hypothetical protein n=1 Tax=uncultured Nitratireductor sp. TaxID=520953 RepID=UPI0025EFEBF5|nr:hypothetical protein [uncultured Nitratireductor sp.]
MLAEGKLAAMRMAGSAKARSLSRSGRERRVIALKEMRACGGNVDMGWAEARARAAEQAHVERCLDLVLEGVIDDCALILLEAHSRNIAARPFGE